MTPEQLVNYFHTRLKKTHGLTDEQADGIIGSTMGESGRKLNPAAFNPNDPDGGARGVFQHVGPRWRNLKSYAEKNGVQPMSGKTQVDFVVDVELNGSEKAALAAVKGAKNRREASDAWTLKFERPHKDYRNLAARGSNADYVAKLRGNGSASGSDYADSGEDTSSVLDGLGVGLEGIQGEDTALRPTTGFQDAAILAGMYKGMQNGDREEGALSAKFMMDLFGGPRNDPRKLTPTEAIAMGLGGALGGIPGAMAGDVIHGIIQKMINPDKAESGSSVEDVGTLSDETANAGMLDTDPSSIAEDKTPGLDSLLNPTRMGQAGKGGLEGLLTGLFGGPLSAGAGSGLGAMSGLGGVGGAGGTGGGFWSDLNDFGNSLGESLSGLFGGKK